MEIRENVALAPLTYYKIGGRARYFAQPASTADLAETAAFIRAHRLRYFILGAGSNVLLPDEGFNGLVIGTSKFSHLLSIASADSKTTLIEAGASTLVIQLLRLCMSSGTAGLEFLVGIPGNMGGVLSMNAGTKTGEVADVVTELTAFDLASGLTRTIQREKMRYGYRTQSFLGAHELILRGVFRGRPSEPKAVQGQIQAMLLARKKSQPIDRPSCGSVFKNPDSTTGLQAWKLIADAGLRGHRIGNAQISELHTNFIVNLGDAKAADVRALIALAKEKVFAQCRVRLEEEVRMIGPDDGKLLL